MTTLYLEHWEPMAIGRGRQDPRLQGVLGPVDPDYLTLSRRDYGHRVGAFRVLDVLAQHGLKVTVALNAGATYRCSRLVTACAQQGCEFAAHGGSAGEMIHQGMPEDEEARVVRTAIEAITAATGRTPTGWIGQDFGESSRTPDIVAASGLTWIMDWSNDDQPYWMTTKPPLVSLPNHSQWDDVQLLELGKLPAARYPAIIREAFDTLWHEGADSSRIFQLGLHPWVIGEPHRIRYLAEALALITGYDNVWSATADDIAQWFSAM